MAKIQGKTKLSAKRSPKSDKGEPLGLINKSGPKFKITSYRITEHEGQLMNEICAAVNKESNSKISKNNILRALIHLGKKTSPTKILSVYRDTL